MGLFEIQERRLSVFRNIEKEIELLISANTGDDIAGKKPGIGHYRTSITGTGTVREHVQVVKNGSRPLPCTGTGS